MNLGKKRNYLFRGLLVLFIFTAYNLTDIQTFDSNFDDGSDQNVPTGRLMNTEQVNTQQEETNVETSNRKVAEENKLVLPPSFPNDKSSEATMSIKSVIKPFSTVANEAGIPMDTFDIPKLLKVTGDKVEVVIGFHSYLDITTPDYKSFLLESNSNIIRELDEIDAIVVDVRISSLRTFLDSWHELPFVRYVELSQITSVSAITNDPDWNTQYGPQIIQTDLAWDIQKGDPSSVLVAVIDTGIDYTHPDLVNQYVTGGYDYYNDDTDPWDDHSHGTHCAGTIGATINNSVGIAGVANVSIMAYKVFNSGGYGSDYDAASAIINATDKGADVLSNSYGFPSADQVLADAVAYAVSNDVVVVVSAGNSGAPVSTYPALYPEVITVSATDVTDTPASFTSYGEAVDVSAPGVDIWSTVPVSMGSYDNKSGTSMACPHVAGVVALIRSEFPSFTADQVQQHLKNSADDLGSIGWDEYFGYGRVNAFKAVQPPPEHDLVTYLEDYPEASLPNKTINFTASVVNYGQENETDINLQLWINGSIETQQVFPIVLVGQNRTFEYSWTPTIFGEYNITVYASPVINETYISNNRNTKIIVVTLPIISYNVGDFIDMTMIANGTPFLSFNYYQNFNENFVRINLDTIFDDWIVVNTLTRLITDGTMWIGGYYMGQIETDLSIGDTFKWYVSTAKVNGTVFYNWDGMLVEAWNVTIAEDMYAYYHKTTGIWLYYYEMGLELGMVNTSFIEWQPPEHDVQISLIHPGVTPVNASTYLNVTIYNEGVNNETDVEAQLWINGTMVDSQYISSLNSGSQVEFSYKWTPVLNGSYNITAYVIPVVNDTILDNNIDFDYVIVKEPGNYLIIQDADPWEYNWTSLLETIGISFDVITSNSFGAVNLSLYDRVIISSDQPQEYYNRINNYLEWLESYVQQGGILEVHAADQGDNLGSWVGLLPGGIDYVSEKQDKIEFVDISNTILFYPNIVSIVTSYSWESSVGGYLANITDANVILSSLNQPVMIEFASGQGYYLIGTVTLELGSYYGESRFFENVLQYNPAPPSHEIGVTLETDTLLTNSTSSLINATVINRGLTTESDVTIELWINNCLVVNNTYTTLTGGTTEFIQYNWNPSSVGIYNITVYALPIMDEFTTLNNYVETSCEVKHLVNYTQYETEFNWFDAVSNGYNVNMSGDDTSYTLILPFIFFYYDSNFSSIHISSNGWFSFVEESPYDYSNPTFPSSGHPYSMAVYWNDLSADNNIYVWNTTSFVVIEYHNYTLLSGAIIGDFELILFSNGSIIMQYRNIQTDSGITIGLNYGLDLAYYTSYSENIRGVEELRLLFSGKPLQRHEINVDVNVPTSILYNETMRTVINTTVSNTGVYNETNIDYQLWINDSLVFQDVISSLLADSLVTYSYEWIPIIRGNYNITAVVSPVLNETYIQNNMKKRYCIISDQKLLFTLGDHIDLYTGSGGSETPWINFTYQSMLDSTHVYVEGELMEGMLTEWMSVNIITGLVEDGSIWVGMTFIGQIDTEITEGDTIQWLEGTGFANGTVWYPWNGATLEAWNITMVDQYSGMFIYYDKLTGVMLFLNDTEGITTVRIHGTSIINPYAPIININYPSSGDIIQGTVTIDWSATDPDNGTMTYSLNYWNGTHWIQIATELQTTSHIWNTSTLQDGDYYRIQVIASDNYSISIITTTTAFIINNVPESPTVQLLYPNGGEVLTGTVTISWIASDPENDSLSFTLYYWYNEAWNLINSGITTYTYDWNTNSLEDNINYSMRIIASDDGLTEEDQSDSSFSIDNPHVPTVTLLSPISEGSFNGTINVTWEASDDDNDSLTFTLSYWDGFDWVELASGLTTGVYNWNISGLPDGNFYRLYIVVTDGSLTGEDQSDSSFSIDNPHAPTVTLLSPISEGSFNGTINVAWEASDEDNDSLTFTLSYWDGIDWIELATGLTTEVYNWNVSGLPNGNFYRLYIVVTDGSLTGEDASVIPFEILNEQTTTSTSPTSTTTTTNPRSSTHPSSTSKTTTRMTTTRSSIGLELLVGIITSIILGSFRFFKRRRMSG